MLSIEDEGADKTKGSNLFDDEDSIVKKEKSKIIKKKKKKKKISLDKIDSKWKKFAEPDETVTQLLTKKDDLIRYSDMPERYFAYKKRKIKLTKKMLFIESKWILFKLKEKYPNYFTYKNFEKMIEETYENTYDININEFLSEKFLIKKCILTLNMIIKYKNEIPFIFFHKSYLIFPPFNINILWDIYELDNLWYKTFIKIKKLKSKLKKLGNNYNIHSSVFDILNKYNEIYYDDVNIYYYYMKYNLINGNNKLVKSNILTIENNEEMYKNDSIMKSIDKENDINNVNEINNCFTDKNENIKEINYDQYFDPSNKYNDKKEGFEQFDSILGNTDEQNTKNILNINTENNYSEENVKNNNYNDDLDIDKVESKNSYLNKKECNDNEYEDITKKEIIMEKKNDMGVNEENDNLFENVNDNSILSIKNDLTKDECNNVYDDNVLNDEISYANNNDIYLKDDLFGEDMLEDKKKEEESENKQTKKIESKKYNEKSIPGLLFLEYVKKNNFNIWDDYLLTTEEFYENISYMYDLIKNEKIYNSDKKINESKKYQKETDNNDISVQEKNERENLTVFKYNCSKIKNIVTNVPEIYVNDLNIQNQIEEWCKSFFSRDILNNKEIFKTLICYYSKLLACHPCIKYILRFFFLKYASLTTVSTNQGEAQIDVSNTDYFSYRLYRFPIHHLLYYSDTNHFVKDTNDKCHSNDLIKNNTDSNENNKTDIFEMTHDPCYIHNYNVDFFNTQLDESDINIDIKKKELENYYNLHKYKHIYLEILKNKENRLVNLIIHPILPHENVPWKNDDFNEREKSKKKKKKMKEILKIILKKKKTN